MGFGRAVRQAEQSGNELTKEEIQQLAGRFDAKRSAVRQRAQQNEYTPVKDTASNGVTTTSNIPLYKIDPSVFNLEGEPPSSVPDTDSIYPTGYSSYPEYLGALELAKQRLQDKGKLDIQKVMNAGYNQVARINKSSNFLNSIMGAFNF